MSSLHEKQKLAVEELTKQAVYEAAVEVITEKSFEKLTMQDIANKAQIATGTLYNYFRNKEDLLMYVDQTLHAFVLEKAKELAELEIEAPDKLKNFSQTLFDECIQFRFVFDSVERLVAGNPDLLKKHEGHLRYIVELIAKIIEEGIGAGTFRKVDAEMVARMYFMGMLGIFDSTVCCTKEYLEELKHSHHAFFDDYLLKR